MPARIMDKLNENQKCVIQMSVFYGKRQTSVYISVSRNNAIGRYNMTEISLGISILAITFTALNFIWNIYTRSEDKKKNKKILYADLLTKMLNLNKTDTDNMLALTTLIREHKSMVPTGDTELVNILNAIHADLGLPSFEDYEKELMEKLDNIKKNNAALKEKYIELKNFEKESKQSFEKIVEFSHFIDSWYIQANAEIEYTHQMIDKVNELKIMYASIAESRREKNK